jgi:ABC-type transport system substrate-binding protein
LSIDVGGRKLRGKPVAILFILVLFLLVVLEGPVESWIYNDGLPEDAMYERFGPRADKLLISLYEDDTSVWDALARGEIDVADWPLTETFYNNFTSNKTNPFTGQPYNETINTVSYGAEFGIFLLDINNHDDEFLGCPPDPAYPNPVYPNPCGVIEFRQALAHLVNRSQLDEIVGKGLHVPLYTLVPPSMGNYSHPEIKPGGALENLTYSYSRAVAEGLLDENGFPVNSSTGWRYWDRNSNEVEDEDEYLELKFYIMSNHPHRRGFGTFMASELEAVKVRVNSILATSGTCFVEVMVNKDFHLFTGGLPLGDDLLNLYDFLTDDYYWHPGFCYNYNGVRDPELDGWLDAFMYGQTIEEAVYALHLVQEVFAEKAFKVPVWSYAGNKAMSRFYSGGNGWQSVAPDDGENKYRGKYWEGAVNRLGYGIDNFWSFLNMHPQGYERGDGENMTIRWGFKTTEIKQLNPIYANFLWDWNILNLIYEGLLMRDPYNLAEFIPWLASDYEVGTYEHPLYGTCTKVRFSMRSDMTWHDGTPITTADVYFTFKELKEILYARGLPSPWWGRNVANVLDFKIFDPYNFEILSDVFSVWFVSWISNSPVLPKHIWKPIAESGPVQDFAPDPNMIGSGPWRFKEHVEDSHVLLVANKPGCTVQTDLPGSTPVTSPIGYYRYHPITVEAKVDGVTKAKTDYYNESHTIDYEIRNLYDENITVNVNVTYPNGTVYREAGVVISSGETWAHSWTGNLQHMKTTSVIVSITSPTEFEGIKSWSHIYYGTIVTHRVWFGHYVLGPDITGSTFYDDIGLPDYPYKRQLPTPDFKVDMRDIATVARAFGSYPGHPRWSPIGDVNDDYKIDMRDIGEFAIKFGWTG